MNSNRRLVVAALALGALVPVRAAFAQQRAPYTEINPPMQADDSGKIDVVEFFWYGCIHCYNLEPALEGWVKRLPADVQFRRVPAVFSNRLAYDAAIFYAFEALGVLDKLHKPFFDAIHKDRLKTEDTAALSEWLQKNGVDVPKFTQTMKSFGVQSRVRRATQLTVASKIDGTPALAVEGRYTVSAEQGGTREGMLKNVDQLIEIVRKKGKG